jgi:predicted TIM-barrel fold metal-dependent hydrolase
MSPSSVRPKQFGRIYAPDLAWLAKQPPEPILEPDLPIIDTHHHLWERPDHRYLLHEFLDDVRTGHNIVATVFVECHAMYRAAGPEEMRPVGQTEFVTGMAAMSASGAYGPTRVAAGIVGFADLTLGDRVEPVLQAHLRAGGGRFRGVRHSGAWDASPIIGNSQTAHGLHLFRQSDFRAGLRRLAALGLTFDAWTFHPQLGDIVELARAVPEASIVVGHCGGPLGYGPYAGKRDLVFAAWKPAIAELARCPNVVMKLGGMMMRLAASDYRTLPAPPTSAELAAHWRPYIETCIEQFGATRCMFESNFPVDKMGIGWAPLWNALKLTAAGASADEKLAMFSGTARRVYRLD